MFSSFPATPANNNNTNGASSAASSPDSEWDDSVANLSFEYVEGENGQIIRRSKESPKSNSRLSVSPSPSSLDSHGRLDEERKGHAPRDSFSRSASAYPILTTSSTLLEDDEPPQPIVSAALNAARSRSFQRAASGPLGAASAKLPRRVTMEESNHIQASLGDWEPDSMPRSKPQAGERAGPEQEQEKENLRYHPNGVVGRRITTALGNTVERHQLPVSVTSGGRIMRSVPSSADNSHGLQRQSYSSYLSTRPATKHMTPGTTNPSLRATGKIAEGDDAKLEDGEMSPTEIVDVERPKRAASNSGLMRQRTYGGAMRRGGSEEGPIDVLGTSSAPSGGRPRRSASVSDTVLSGENPDGGHGAYPIRAPSRPGTSASIVRRMTPEELDHRPHRQRDSEEMDQQRHQIEQHLRAQQAYLARQSPPPQQSAMTPAPSHRRRDSDTLRGGPTPTQPSGLAMGSSPTTVQPQVPARLSPSARHVPMSHRRSPTGPTAPSVSAPASGDEESPPMPDKERKVKKDSTSASASLVTDVHGVLQQTLVVNKKTYARLGMIGRGGSSRVFRVMSSTNQLYAVKRVALDKTDSETLNGYMNEIALLKRLNGNSRIIRLIDSEVRPGAGGSKGHLILLMELGEIDFAKLLSEQQKEPLNMIWVGYYWQQMLQAVQVIHDEKIVHSDLKPGNFVLVRGQLKLIDFGIANAIANDTTNIHRDAQVGTVNYMSPEAMTDCNTGLMKVGRGSDVWSLGCILYQMVYGTPPFHALSIVQKMRAIPDPNYLIEYPEYSTPSLPASKGSSPETSTPPRKLEHLKRRVQRRVITTIQKCLLRNPKERATIPILLAEDWISETEAAPSSSTNDNHDQNTNRSSDAIPPLKDILKPDQTVITPHYMRQLLVYAQQLKITDDQDPQLDLEAQRLVQELREMTL